jgi:hypothetical protein
VISPSSASILDQSRIGGHPENKYMQVPLSIEKARAVLYNKTAEKFPEIQIQMSIFEN